MALDGSKGIVQSRSGTCCTTENLGSSRFQTARLLAPQRCNLPTIRKCTARRNANTCLPASRKEHPPKARSTDLHPHREPKGRCRRQQGVSKTHGGRSPPGPNTKPAAIGDAESVRTPRTLLERTGPPSNYRAATGPSTTRRIWHSPSADRKKASQTGQDLRPIAASL